ncbi:MAG: type II toxin-antitoxin system RelE family toxin, partial [Acidimicrobiales bacterium]
MSFRVLVARSAARRLAERLPEPVAAACVEFIFGALAADPRRVGAPLRKPFDGQWRARRGEYRIRYRIDEDSQTVYVLDIDHRRDIGGLVFETTAEHRPTLGVDGPVQTAFLGDAGTRSLDAALGRAD